MSSNIAPLTWIAERYLEYNPFFIYSGRNPLLHQTEVVAKSLFIKPTRMLIADMIGLGKTITALRVLAAISRYRGHGLKRVLVAVPSVLVDQWVDEMKKMGISPTVIDRKSVDVLARSPELPSGWYVGSIDTLKQDRYMDILIRNRWDAIVVDEAHKLGYIGYEPNDRWKSLGRIIMDNRDAVLLLLSATPHRGKARDYLARLALIDPSLIEEKSVGALDKVFDKPDFYRQTHNVILIRRSKEDVNTIYEKAEIFKPCTMIAVLIEPGDAERKLLTTITDLAAQYLREYYNYMINNYGFKPERAQAIVALLRTLLIKRGLSSPQALVKTFSKLVMKRGGLVETIGSGRGKELEKAVQEIEERARELDDILSGDVEDLEEELDEWFNGLMSYLSMFLESRLVEKLEDAKRYAESILSGNEEDSKVRTLEKILRLVMKANPGDLPAEFMDLASRKAIVFTEFKDTARYIYNKLVGWAREELGDPGVVRMFTSENREEIDDIRKWLSEDAPRILITTDVAGEGLNLQHANVVINYEIAWSPIRLEQRIGRVWRYGQNRNTYVFNLFLADAMEKTVAEVVFAKLYGISISVGKLDPILGERVLLSTIKNELLEHAVGSRETIGELIPLEIDFKGKKISLSESKIIELVVSDAKNFVMTFIETLERLVSEINHKKIFPSKSSSEEEAERVRENLLHLTGFRDLDDAITAVRKIVTHISAQPNLKVVRESEDEIMLRSSDGVVFKIPLKNPEEALKTVQSYFKAGSYPKYFVYKCDRREVMLLSEASIIARGSVIYREPIGVVGDLETGSIRILRGTRLVEKLLETLDKSIPVDEVYGLTDAIESARQEVLLASHNTFYEEELRKGVGVLLSMLSKYEDVKSRLGCKSRFYMHDLEADVNVKIAEPQFIMFSSAFLPEVKEVPSDEVWRWAEDDAIPIVHNYERLSGREATMVSGYEHYDVKSIKRGEGGEILEVRFIEVKTKAGRSLDIDLTGEEFRAAREKGKDYWLYIVYGVRTEKPAMLCVRDPASKIPFERIIITEERVKYHFTAG
ncbi:helicase-related protein [Infirmifilum sp.]|uniref:helicase-related protein n=1 Tax=Infirmifilum sp. TaxID=2856575 RepID=UPI003D12B41F